MGLVASDFLVRTPFPVPRDVKVRSTSLTRDGGGPAANAAVALARLGVRTSFLGAVGRDGLGDGQLAALSREGVDVAAVPRVDGVPSFAAFVLVDESDGARTIFSSLDERPLLTAEAARLPAPPPHLVLTDGWAGPGSPVLVRKAREASVPVLLDAGSLRPETEELLPWTDVAVVSEPFARDFAGSPEAALAGLKERGVRLVAVTQGPEGVLASARGAEGTFRVEAFPVPRPVDTTGAGDAFHAGTAWGLLRGLDWESSLRAGAAVAALQCGRIGARAGLPDAERVRRLLGA